MQHSMDYIREARSAMQGPVTLEVNPETRLNASWSDVSRVGARVVLGCYVRTGRVVALTFTAPWNSHTEVMLQARVIWCRQGGDSAEFLVGLQVLRETPEAALAFSLVRQISRDAANRAETHVVLPTMWPNFRPIADRQPQPEAAEIVSVAV